MALNKTIYKPVKSILDDGLTFRQRNFVKRTLETLDPTQAAMESYNIGGKGGKSVNFPVIASSMAIENLEKPKIRKAFEIALKELDDNKYLGELNEMAMNDNDKRVKLQAIDMILKLKDRYPANKLKLTAQNEQREQLIEIDSVNEVNETLDKE